MKTKKILSVILAVIMMMSFATTSFAAEVTSNGGTGETVVTYGMDEGFTVTIPTNFTIDSTKKATADVSASNVMIAHGKILEVAVSGDDYDVTGSWELIDEAEAANKLTYTIGTTEGGTDITNGSIVLDVEAGEAYGSTVTETMYFTVIDELSKAGTYKDTLTFTVGIEGSSNSGNGAYATTFADNSWGDIITAVQNDEVPSTWAVGDIKPMTINGTEYNVQIIGKNHDTYTSGGTAPLTFQLVEIYTETCMYSSGYNSMGWSGSEMRTTTLSTILSAMPSEVQSAIKAVDKLTLKGSGADGYVPLAELETTSDKLFLLSEVEVLGSTTYSNGFAEGSRYEFYANGGSAVKTYNGNADWWWLRGPYYNNGNHFSDVNSIGTLDLYAALINSGGVSFGFCF